MAERPSPASVLGADAAEPENSVPDTCGTDLGAMRLGGPRRRCTNTTPCADHPMRFGVPDDPEATEHLRTQLVAITEAERRALNDAGLFIASSCGLPGAQWLAQQVQNVANRGGVPAATSVPDCVGEPR